MLSASGATAFSFPLAAYNMNRMTAPLAPLDRDWLIKRLKQSGETPARAPRGDHDLNPGTRTTKTLTPAAVLVPLIDHAGQPTVLLTRRTGHLANHPGQVSFPGGHSEPGDGSLEETAIRETQEETGIERHHIDVVGRLDDYETRTGFRVTPVVAMITPTVRLKARRPRSRRDFRGAAGLPARPRQPPAPCPRI